MAAAIELDDLDRRILTQIQDDAALSNQALALRVHASAATCLRRVKRLHDVGVIHKQVALLAPEKIAAGLSAIVEISLDRQASEDFASFEKAVQNVVEVLQCYRVAPGPDFVLMLQVSDMPHYHRLAHQLFTSNANVRNVRAFFVTHRSKFETRIAV